MSRNRSYRKIYEEFHEIKIPKGMHIHHIDGNKNNNDISNLELLTPDEHAQKHGYLNNWIMAQDRASKLGIEKLKSTEIRKKMSESMINSDRHKLAIEKRNKNETWRKNVSEACKITAKTRPNIPWNKGQSGSIKLSESTKTLMSSQRIGRKWFNDGINTYFIYPEQALPHYSTGRK